MAELREYGVATEVYMVVPKVDDTDLAATGDYAYTAGDIKLSKDGAATANPASSPTEIDMGTFMFLQIDLSASEMQCESLLIQIADAALEHNALVIETYGHASSRHPGILGSANAQKLDLQLEYVEHDTATAGTSSSITLNTGASTTDDFYNNSIVYIVGGTGAGQMPRFIDDYTGSTLVADVSPAWSTTPDNTSVYLVIPSPPASTSTPPAVNVTQNDGVAITATGGRQEVDVTHVSGVAEDLPTATALATVDTVVDAILVDTGTTLDGKINTIDSNVDAILVDTGTTLDTKINTIDTNVDAILVDTGTTLDTKIDTIDTVVDAIKAVTDNLPDSGALSSLATAANLATLDTTVNALNDMSLSDLYTYAVEDAVTFEQMLRLMAAVLFGKVSGNPNGATFRSLGDDVDRVAATTDSDGNRTAVVLDATD